MGHLSAVFADRLNQKLKIIENYRPISGAMITGSSHSPPDAQEIPHLMKEFVHWIKSSARILHPVELAALAHHRLVHIHPFADGNGRTGRLLMNLLLMQQGYPLVTILKHDRKKYYDVLDKADRGNQGPMIQLIAQAAERSLNLYLKVLQPAKAGKSVEIGRYAPLSEIAKSSPYSTKYLNLFIRTGKMEGHKEGRNWVSSPEALDRYLKSRQRKRKIGRKSKLNEDLSVEKKPQRKI